MEYPRVLVISNNSFSKTSNNGRTLGNLFQSWPKEKLAQFCISTTKPDYDICDNYYLLTDGSVYYAFKHFRRGKRCDLKSNLGSEGNTIINGNKMSKTPIKRLLRHIVWGGDRWDSNDFRQWVDNFNPEIVLVMNSDATFILDIALKTSKRKDVPLVMYNTEGFYFIEAIKYRHYGPLKTLSQKVYNHIYRKHFRRMMERVSLSIHLNSLLEEDYRNEFGGNHMVIYTGSGVEYDSSNLHLEAPSFAYLGNFGYDRPSVLVEIAEVLQTISPDYKLDVFGKSPSYDIERKFKDSPGIVFHGMIPYEEVVKLLHSTTILFHAETQSMKYAESLRYGFSTKIADSISSGHPFLMFSSSKIAGAKYIIETGAGWFAENRNDLKDTIIKILSDNNCRDKVLLRAQQVAKTNHSITNNSIVFNNAIQRVFEQN